MSGGLDVLALKEDDVTKMLAAGTHLGAENVNFQMEQYVYKKRVDGRFFFSLSLSPPSSFLPPSFLHTILHKILISYMPFFFFFFTIIGAGVNVINLRHTWEKLLLAARAIVAIEHPSEVFVISCRHSGQRAVLKFAAHTGATPIAGRFTPGAFTNQIQVKK